ncbi:hypothetical protein RBU60_06060 [Mesonia sp. MT50]|uniref:Uncharacterized protein n=1 Tax=Mesonia profundi TaxID=3070998 RepID=A0ABU1A0B0_9FLAO|nr:hypothetical protein [Mesonia profundi]MDQ7917133.1 hypothetical protein [Mesonia profundi]
MKANKDQNNKTAMPSTKTEIFPQEEKTKEEISNLLLYSYKDDAYGRLQELYDRIKNSDMNMVSDKEAKGLFFEIERVTNEAKDYAMRTYLKEEKLNNIVRRIADINKVKNNINCFSKEELDEWIDAFDFELKPEYPQEHKEVKYVERASEISKKIDEACKAATVKTNEACSNKEKEGKKSSDINNKETKHPLYDANLFNEKGYDFFKYLIENYVKVSKHGDKTRFMNIWHYFNNELNNSIKFEKHKRLTKKAYKELAKHYEIEITNTDKTPSYENKHLPTLNSHFEAFKNNLSNK